MADVRFTPRAEEDLRNIWRYIAPHNLSAADALLSRIFDKLDLAAAQPAMGVLRADLSPTARILIEGSYIVIYEPATDGILAVSIVHGMRDPESWMD